MVAEDRLRWLLGEEEPTWAIPDGIYQDQLDEIDSVADDRHVDLHDLEVVAGGHPEHVDGVHNRTLRHVDDDGRSHLLVVTASGPAAVEQHLHSTSVWTKTRQGGVPEPIQLGDIVVKAVDAMGGGTIGGMVAGRSGVSLVTLLGQQLGGDAYGDVVAGAVQTLEAELQGLADRGVITDDDLGALDPWALIEGLVAEPAEDFVPRDDGDDPAELAASPAHVSMWLAPEEDGAGHLFSILDIGSIGRGRSKRFSTKNPKKTKVYVRAGRVRVSGAMRCGSIRRLRSCQRLARGRRIRVFAYQRSSVRVTGVAG